MAVDLYPSQSGTSVLKAYGRQVRTAGNLSINSGGSWANLPSLSTIVMTAATGDLIEVGMNGLWDTQNVEVGLDVVTWVGGAPVNYLSGGGGGASDQGVAGWRSAYVTSNIQPFGGSVIYVLQAGDISAGQVTLQVRYRSFTSTLKTLYATTALPLHFWAKNFGAAPA